MNLLTEWLHRPVVAISLVLVTLFGGLLVDLTTQQALVVAIIYNIPIALSGVGTTSQRLTIWTVVLALGANVAAAYENALQIGGYDGLVIANRGLAALSFLIVGAMTLARETAVEEVGTLSDAEATADREERLRRLLRDLGNAYSESALLAEVAGQLRRLLQAEAVAIAALRDRRFAEPRYGEELDELTPLGDVASWVVDAIPTNDRPAISIRSERGLVTAGRLRRDGDADLVVIAELPRAAKASYLLGEALYDIEPLLRRARQRDPAAPQEAG